MLCHSKLSSGPHRHPKNVLFLQVKYATICIATGFYDSVKVWDFKILACANDM